MELFTPQCTSLCDITRVAIRNGREGHTPFWGFGKAKRSKTANKYECDQLRHADEVV